MKELIETIKKHEGFEPKPYIDILVRKNPDAYGITSHEMNIIKKHLDTLTLTFGYGFTFLTKEECDAVLEIRVKNIVKHLEEAKPIINSLPLEKQSILVEMTYQMGVSGILKFKNMWAALEVKDYDTAAKEMLSSKWASQTPNRATELSMKMMS